MRNNTENKKNKFLNGIAILLGAVCILIVVGVFCIIIQQRNESIKEAERISHVADRENASTKAEFISEENIEEVMGGANPLKAPIEVVEKPEAVISYVEKCGLDYVEKPIKRNLEEIYKKLSELAADNEDIAYVYERAENYPEMMLAVLTMNPEMADFVRGYGDPDREAVSGGLTEQEQEQEFPLLLQWDPRWGYVEYGDDSCIGLSGCGPTCLSMVLYYLTGDKALTPEVIGQYSMENDYYMWGTGTKWALLEDVAVLYGITVSQPDTSLEEMKSALEEDKLIICSMGPGEFTTAGHFIVIYGYKDGEFCINDPNCVARSRRTWSYEEIADQIKHLWIFEK